MHELEKKRAQRLLDAFCGKRVPAAVRAQVWMEHTKRGNTYTLLECRPHFSDPNVISRMPIARFKYDDTDGVWSLYYPDRNDRFHIYFEDVGDTLEELIAEVDEDPTCIFWG